MGGIFYVVGLGLAGFAGYTNLNFYFIFISSLIMAIGYFIVRAPQIQAVVARDGALAVPKMLILQMAVYSIVTAPIYFVASLFS